MTITANKIRILRLVMCAAAMLSCLGVLTASAAAASGDLDGAFGTGGTVFSDVVPGASDRAQDVAVQPDGKILAAGPAANLVRYDRNGRLDTSFDGDGHVQAVIQVTSVAVAPAGKIVVAGDDGLGAFAVARYNSNGTLDTSFGDGGKKVTAFYICNLECGGGGPADRVVIQPDGKVVLAGDLSLYSFGSYFRYLGVARYTSDGQPDTGFGDDGSGKTYVQVDATAEGEGLALQGDGKIVLATGQASDFVVLRLLASGPRDPDFGTAGLVRTDFGGNDAATDVAVHGDKIVAAGSTNSGQNSDFAMARYSEADGSLDPGFGTAGKVTIDVGGQDIPYAVAVQDDGKLVMAGSSATGADPSDFALTRSNPDGSPDPTFSGDGKLTTALGPDRDVAYALALQPDDGKIIAAGSSVQNGDEGFALARYQGVSADLSLSGTGSPDPVTVGERLSGSAPRDTTRPVLSGLSLSPTSFRAAGSGASIASVVGTRVSYRRSEAGSVKFRVERALSGRRSHGRCVTSTRSNRRAKRCTRYSTLPGSFTHTGKAAKNTFRFSGRLAGRKLKPGRYRLNAVATDTAGNTSALKRLGFRIVKG